MRARLGIPLLASALLACALLACVLVACGLTVSGSGPLDDPDAAAVDGAGLVVSCTVASDCPVPPNDCLVATCDGNRCATTNIMAGAACTAGVGCAAPTDCPAQSTVCKTNTCQSNACATAFAAKGTACTDNGGVVCDGSGDCVPLHCTDGSKDSDETDVDCGGSCGATCKDTGPQQGCLVGGDCVSRVCTGTPRLCQPPGCNDGVQNGNETAVDCGGPSCDAQGKTCAAGQPCKAATDCTSGYCPGSTTCQLRPDGKACTANAQCLHGACLAVAGGGKVCCNTGCADQGAASCGTNGQCKANGSACADYPSGTSCGGATCSGSTLSARTCSGTGACQAGASSTCTGHLSCNGGGTACLVGCGSNDSTGDANCIAGYWCDGAGGGACQLPQAAGGPCNRGAQCQTMCNTGLGKCK